MPSPGNYEANSGDDVVPERQKPFTGRQNVPFPGNYEANSGDDVVPGRQKPFTGRRNVPSPGNYEANSGDVVPGRQKPFTGRQVRYDLDKRKPSYTYIRCNKHALDTKFLRACMKKHLVYMFICNIILWHAFENMLFGKKILGMYYRAHKLHALTNFRITHVFS